MLLKDGGDGAGAFAAESLVQCGRADCGGVALDLDDVGGDGGDLLLFGAQLSLLLSEGSLRSSLLGSECGLLLLDRRRVGGYFLLSGLEAGLRVHRGFKVGAFELDAVGDELVLAVVVAANLDGEAGDEGGHGHLLGATVEDAFDFTDVGGVGEEDGGVGRTDDLEGHGGATAAVDNSLDFRLSDDRSAGEGKHGDEQNGGRCDFECGAVFHDVSLAEATGDPYMSVGSGRGRGYWQML